AASGIESGTLHHPYAHEGSPLPFQSQSRRQHMLSTTRRCDLPPTCLWLWQLRHRLGRGRMETQSSVLRRDSSMKPWPELTKCIHLDNRGLEPPEPMMRILTALKRLGDDEYILAHNDREPMFLYPKLKEMGYPYESEV